MHGFQGQDERERCPVLIRAVTKNAASNSQTIPVH